MRLHPHPPLPPPAPAAGLGAWWHMFAFWLPTRYWWMLSIADPGMPPAFAGPAYMTEDEATDWQLDVQENAWNTTVLRYRWDGSRWSRG